MKLYLKLIAIFFMVAMLNGCGDDIPKCDSKEAKQLLTQIITDPKNYSSFFLSQEETKNITLENILTESVNKEIKNTNCSVDVLVDGKKYYTGRALYKLSITSDGKLYVQARLQ